MNPLLLLGKLVCCVSEATWSVLSVVAFFKIILLEYVCAIDSNTQNENLSASVIRCKQDE